jgi:NAD(P)-dependent dehydrogenase (short-subunit alcohol dehydrogenase family)
MHGAVDFQLQGKRALLSGSTAGIGFAIARALAAEGASVIVNGRTEARTQAAVAAIRDSGLPEAAVRGVAARSSLPQKAAPSWCTA